MNDSSKHIKLLTGALKKCSVLLCAIQLLFGFELLHAQVIRNNGAAVKISSGAVVTGKDLENAADTITNNGTIELKGNWTNTAAYQPGMGTVVFNGNDTIADQLITKTGGQTFHDFIVNRGFLFFLRTVKLNNDVTVNNALNLISGRLNLNAKNLTVEGPITSTTGTITGHDSSNIIINGSGAIGTITFTSGSGVIHDFKLMRANNTAALGSDLAVGGHFAIADTLGLSNDLTLNGTDECGGFINASAGTVTYASNGLIVINGTYSNLTIAQNAVMCGDVTVNGTLAFTNGVLDLNGHTLTLNGSTSLAAGTIKGGSTSNIIISSSNNSGMLLPQISGGLNNLTINKTGTTNTVTLSNALNIAGNATLSNGVLITAYNINFNGTTTCGSGSINATTDTATFNNVSYVFPGNYNNLLKIGASTATLCGNVGISGNLTVSTGTFEITSYSISVSGTTNVYGILSDNNISGTNLFVGPVTIYAGGAWNFSGNGAAELRNGLTYNGVSFNSGTGAYSFTKNNQNIAGSSQIVFNGSVLIGTNVTLTNNNSFAVSGVTFKAALNGTDGTSKYVNQVITSYEWTHSAYGAPMSTGILDATYTGNTFRYSGAVQDITAGTYYYLEINGSGSKTFNGNVNVNSNLNVLNGTTIAFGSASIYTMDIKGNFNASNGAINMTNGTNINHKLILEGLNNSCNLLNADDQSEIQYIGGDGQQVFGSTNYRNIVFGGTGTKVLQGNVTASGNTITLNTMVSTGPYVLYLSIPTVTINRSTGVVIGNLKRSVNTTSYNYSFAVGTDTSFNPLQIKFTNLTSGDYLVNFKTGNIGNAGLPLNDHGVEIYAMFTNGYWSTQASNSLASSNYSITLTTSGFGIDSSSRILKKEGGNLFVNGINGGISGLDITRNTLNEISPTNTSFAIGQGRPNISTQPLNDTVCHEATAQFFVGATGVGTLTYQWFKTGSPDIQLSNTGNIKGATSSTLFIDNANFADDGYYYCIITDANGHPKESNPAILVVNTIPVLTLVKPVDTICNAQYAKITIAPAVSDTTYSWTVQPDAGISGAKSGGGILINQIITNSNNYVAKVIYVITPMGPKPTYCVGLSKYDTIWVNPTAILRVNTQDTILCDSSTFTISVDDRNGAVKGSKVYQLTTTYYTDSLGGVEQSTTDIIAGTDITNRIVNNTKNLQKVTYNFKPMIKNPHQGVSYCNISKDTSITIYVNPTPQMSIKSDTVFCDSASVNLILASLNGTILGDKYYQITTTFNNSKAVVNNTMNGTFPIHSFSNQLINKTIGLDTIFYNVVPVFRNPRKNDTTEFCSVGVPVIFRRYVLPALKAILIDTTYAGGSNNTIKCYGDKNLSYKDKNNKNVVHLAIPNNTGKIKAMISGGLTVPPYSQLQDNCTFSWSNNSNTRIISGLNAGTYSLSVTDGHGCKTGAKTVLTNPPKLISEDTIIQGFKCSSATKGIMLATPVGGTKPYSYEWATVDGRIVFNDTVTDLVEGTQNLVYYRRKWLHVNKFRHPPKRINTSG